MIYRWAPESHGLLGQQTATIGSQGPGKAFVHESTCPAFVGAVNQASVVVCALGKTKHFLRLSWALSSQVFFHQHAVPFSHMHTCGCEQAAQDRMYFEDICPSLSSGKSSLSPFWG